MPPFPKPLAPELAKLIYRTFYEREPCLDLKSTSESSGPDMVVRDEYLGEVIKVRPEWQVSLIPLGLFHVLTWDVCELDYYGVTFDHLVPSDELDPKVLQINIIEVESDGGEYANKYLPFLINVADYAGKRVLAVPRCCQGGKA